jgi:hypothetical protein
MSGGAVSQYTILVPELEVPIEIFLTACVILAPAPYCPVRRKPNARNAPELAVGRF